MASIHPNNQVSQILSCLTLLIAATHQTRASYPCHTSTSKRYESIEDMDLQVSALTPFGLARALPLGDVRPRWATMQSWWDLNCDRDLLLGSFLHGFGAYAKMRFDPRLCFASKVSGAP